MVRLLLSSGAGFSAGILMVIWFGVFTVDWWRVALIGMLYSASSMIFPRGPRQ
jgi:hypothetical protein